MALYFQIIFAMLVTEIAVLSALLGPLPLSARHQLMKIQHTQGYFLNTVSYGIKLALIANTVFLVDSVQRVRSLTAEEAVGKLSNPGQMHDVATSANFRSRLVYAQRNMYLTGFTLFLAFVIVRVFSLLVNETVFEDRINELEAEFDTDDTTAVGNSTALNSMQKERHQKAALDQLSAKAAK